MFRLKLPVADSTGESLLPLREGSARTDVLATTILCDRVRRRRKRPLSISSDSSVTTSDIVLPPPNISFQTQLLQVQTNLVWSRGHFLFVREMFVYFKIIHSNLHSLYPGIQFLPIFFYFIYIKFCDFREPLLCDYL